MVRGNAACWAFTPLWLLVSFSPGRFFLANLPCLQTYWHGFPWPFQQCCIFHIKIHIHRKSWLLWCKGFLQTPWLVFSMPQVFLFANSSIQIASPSQGENMWKQYTGTKNSKKHTKLQEKNVNIPQQLNKTKSSPTNQSLDKSHRIHVWYIYLHLPLKKEPNVGKAGWPFRQSFRVVSLNQLGWKTTPPTFGHEGALQHLGGCGGVFWCILSKFIYRICAYII